MEATAAISVDLVKNNSCGTLESADAVAKLSCITQSLADSAFLMLGEAIRALNIIGYYQTLNLDFGVLQVQPLANLAGASGILSSQAFALQIILILLGLQLQILQFISQNAIALIFPLGLAFRSFFATRRVGGFLVALAVALFIFYPVFVFIFPNPQTDVVAATGQLANFTNRSDYATVPVLDLNSNLAVAQKIDSMSGVAYIINTSEDNSTNTTIKVSTGVDFTSDITKIIQQNSIVISKMLMFSVIAPLFSLAISMLFIKELGNILGGEMISVSVFRNI
jgi:hypothetical protein